MSWRRTSCKNPQSQGGWAAGIGIALLASCGGGPSGPEVRPEGEPRPFKLSHFRSYEDQRTKKLAPTYRVVMSNGWKDRMGEGPREPLMSAAPRAQYVGYADDEKMAYYFRTLQEYGVEKLEGRNPDTLKPQELAALSQHPTLHAFHRVFTLGTDRGAKSYYYMDHHVPGKERLLEIFLKCELYVVSVMQGHSVQTRVWSNPVQTRDR